MVASDLNDKQSKEDVDIGKDVRIVKIVHNKDIPKYARVESLNTKSVEKVDFNAMTRNEVYDKSIDDGKQVVLSQNNCKSVLISNFPPSDLALAYQWAFNINASPIDVNRFKYFLSGYDSTKFEEVVDIVENGAQIPSLLKNNPNVLNPTNQKSTIEHKVLVDQMLMNELKENRIAGPFLKSPPNLIISPLGAVPKKESNKVRIIHNLSHPKNNSVNSNIPDEFKTVEYELIDVCCEIVSSIGRFCLMSKGDYANAFRLLKVRLQDLRFLGFVWNKLIYFDKMMPMGAAVSCAQFEKFSCAIQWILQNKFAVKFMSHILDDFLFFGHPGSTECK